MPNIVIIIILIFIIITIFYYINNYDVYLKQNDNICHLENFDIDKIHIIKREPEYQRLINKLLLRLIHVY